MKTVRISFNQDGFAPFEAKEGAELSDVLDGTHSPVFFGCKTGNCGTCLIELDPAATEKMAPPSEDEKDLLDALAPGRKGARLACQLKAQCDVTISYLN
jgi:ferredoxin